MGRKLDPAVLAYRAEKKAGRKRNGGVLRQAKRDYLSVMAKWTAARGSQRRGGQQAAKRKVRS